ncbi:hypothetical protein [Embleya scabrispora]|uniref:hypothetical protein n=1 Tax=Embleya scabrispora TaxID=159449 RepID=UPI000375AF3F|nr:hypothetical protein [Embleya scabrispora]MYS78700.1 hypothetical protein [Streptomyces sp. SID5474]
MVSGRWLIALRAAAGAVVVLAVVVLTAAGTARSTVLNRAFYQAALDDERAYTRMYDEVLVDPAAEQVTRDLLARIPVPPSVVTANLKSVLPPATLRGIVDQQIANTIGYLRGEQSTLRLTVDLRPVLANVGDLAELYLGDLIANVQGRPSADFAAFRSGLDATLDDLAAGRRPADFPTFALDGPSIATTTDALVAIVPVDARAQVRAQVTAALATGDIAGALAVVGPHVLGGSSGSARSDLAARTDDGQWDLLPELKHAGLNLNSLSTARTFTKLALGPVQTLATVLGIAAVLLLWFTGPRSWSRRVPAIAWSLVVGGVLSGALVLLIRSRLPSMLAQPAPSWPHSVNALVGDVQHAAISSLTGVGLFAALVPLVLGLALVSGAWSWRRAAARRALNLPPRHRIAIAATVGAFAVAAVVLGATVVPVAAGKTEARHCLGSIELCDRRYDEVAYLTTHNAMASTADRFIGPLQDPDIVGQLNAGVRGLQLDTYTWELPEQVQPRLSVSSFAPDMQAEILHLIDLANPPRPGLWLCHALCRAGALALAPTLHRIGTWLEKNPGEVVTLILQNDITGEQTEQAFREAGVERLLYTPSPDPAAKWPKLGEMVREDKRLVVFAEQGGGPAPWYRNFYEYGMETPFAFASPAEMSCVPNRGGTDKRLFLLNHFVTNLGGSRLDAGRVNARQYVLDRARACEAQRGRPVNFVAVDYATIGDAAGAVEVLNATRGGSG